MSVGPGETVKFHISSDRNYTVDYIRLRSPADVFQPGDPLMPSLSRSAATQSVPPAYAWQGFGWSSDNFPPLQIPPFEPSDGANTWKSGYYAARCCSDDGSDFYIPFVVRPSKEDVAGRYKRFAMLASTLTWNAYNPRGGRSQYYDGKSEVTLGFERPFPFARPCGPYLPIPGTPTDAYYASWDPEFNSRHTLRADLWLASWLEDPPRNYQVDLFTDLDFHIGEFNPADYAGLILATHPEYWTVEMRDRLDQYLSEAGSLVYLGGNGLFERVEFPLDFSKMRVSGRGPGPGFGNRWLFRFMSRPERSVLGVAYESRSGSGPYFTRAADHRFFAKTGLEGQYNKPFGQSGLTSPAGGDGTQGAGRACGWEVDTSATVDDDSAPLCTTVLAASAGESEDACQMVAVEDCHRGCLVYSVGSLCYGGSLVQDEVLDRILQNVLGECILIATLRHELPMLRWLLELTHIWPPEITPPRPPEGPDWRLLEDFLADSRPDSIQAVLGRAIHPAFKGERLKAAALQMLRDRF
ncbi:MAG: hypothetical protein JO208_07185 [Alphaproteobacteria bacterium]|nr:hypothetical protein [Alphaproteobacteria bacterium]